MDLSKTFNISSTLWTFCTAIVASGLQYWLRDVSRAVLPREAVAGDIDGSLERAARTLARTEGTFWPEWVAAAPLWLLIYSAQHRSVPSLGVVVGVVTLLGGFAYMPNFWRKRCLSNTGQPARNVKIVCNMAGAVLLLLNVSVGVSLNG